MYAEVAVNSPLPHSGTFTYTVPPGMDVKVGHAVYVPFGSRTLQGIVVRLTDTPSWNEARAILETIETQPLLWPHQVALAEWMSAYYAAPLFTAISLMLPPGFERRPVTLAQARATVQDVLAPSLSPAQRLVLDILTHEGEMELKALGRRVEVPRLAQVVEQLVRKGLVVKRYELARPRVRPKVVYHVRLQITPDEARRQSACVPASRASRRADLLEALAEQGELPLAEARRIAGGWGSLNRLVAEAAISIDSGEQCVRALLDAERLRTEARALRQTRAERALTRALSILAETGGLPLAELRARSGLDPESLRRLVADGIVQVEEEVLERNPLAGRVFERQFPPPLTADQQAAVHAIASALERRESKPYLLYGVTGSGKTEVYLRALERTLALGRRAIVLVPEIALTPQVVQRFAARFPGLVTVIHSRLTLGERDDQWRRIREGKYAVVIGSRSALFAPQPDLGLIIQDEEHEWTYKQQDLAPRYHARTVAERLAALTGAVLLLGSATPDVVTYYRALTGQYALLRLPDRIVVEAGGQRPPTVRTQRALPSVELVDMRDELKAGNRSVFSNTLRTAIAQTLAAGEQVILFLNRRGSASFLLCRDCGYVPRCSGCDVALTYHADVGCLLCHLCNRRRRLPPCCPGCGRQHLRPVGLGTQGLEEETARCFPGARILRWDRDVTRGRDQHERILTAFLNHEADILIGTQMIAKGLDIPRVTLVGVVNADISLHLPDYRSGERTFQLLMQVAGRAGRGPGSGRVIVQTYNPSHYAIAAVATHDAAGFYTRELESRRRLGYPPFGRLIRLLYAHTNERCALRESIRLRAALEAERAAQDRPEVDIIGPSPAYIRRLRGRFRWQLLLRGDDPEALMRGFDLPPGWTVDVDPVSLL